eukprot:847372-Rhodomonas_salina.1
MAGVTCANGGCDGCSGTHRTERSAHERAHVAPKPRTRFPPPTPPPLPPRPAQDRYPSPSNRTPY